MVTPRPNDACTLVVSGSTIKTTHFREVVVLFLVVFKCWSGWGERREFNEGWAKKTYAHSPGSLGVRNKWQLEWKSLTMSGDQGDMSSFRQVSQRIMYLGQVQTIHQILMHHLVTHWTACQREVCHLHSNKILVDGLPSAGPEHTEACLPVGTWGNKQGPQSPCLTAGKAWHSRNAKTHVKQFGWQNCFPPSYWHIKKVKSGQVFLSSFPCVLSLCFVFCSHV